MLPGVTRTPWRLGKGILDPWRLLRSLFVYLCRWMASGKTGEAEKSVRSEAMMLSAKFALENPRDNRLWEVSE